VIVIWDENQGLNDYALLTYDIDENVVSYARNCLPKDKNDGLLSAQKKIPFTAWAVVLI